MFMLIKLWLESQKQVKNDKFYPIDELINEVAVVLFEISSLIYTEGRGISYSKTQ